MKKSKALIIFLLSLFMTALNAFSQPGFENRIDMGLIESADLVEASGIVESRKNDHVIWSHNDRNHFNRIFALNTQGTHLGSFWIEGVENRDWEDIAIGPGPVEGLDYIYIADVGDNYSEYELKYIYRFPEPAVSFNQEPVEESIYNVETITFQYPDGMRDSETMMLDPLSKDIYVVSKRELDDIRVYRAPYPQSTVEVIILDHVATLNLWQVVGGDISPSGLEILMKTYTNMYYWTRNPGQELWQAFDSEPVILPYIEEMQGEAVCWAADSMGYYTLSEENYGFPVHLFFYPRNNPSLVVVNEIMQNPYVVEDANGEWFEIYNNSEEPVDLNGWIIKDMDADFHIITQSLILSPEEYLVLGNNSDENSNGGVSIDYQYNNIVLDNSGDEILIVSPGGLIVDSVAYYNSASFPNLSGASMALLDPNMENSVGLNWKSSETPYGDGDLGTPGLSNSAVIRNVAIKDIQYTDDPSGFSPLIDQRVTISGVLTTEPFGSFFKDYFFVQDSVGMWSGIMVKHITEAARGDSIILTGTVADNFGCVTTLIDVSDFEILKNGVFGINPICVSTGEIGTGGENAEAYEGVLVRATGNCDNNDLGWREWSIDDGSGPVNIYHPFVDEFTPILGNTYEIHGIQYYNHRNAHPKILVLTESGIIENPQGVDIINEIPGSFKLCQNYPNPVNAVTTIFFQLPKSSKVNLSIYNTSGQLVKTLLEDYRKAGSHSVLWDANHLTSGMYFYKIEADEYVGTKKCLILK